MDTSILQRFQENISRQRQNLLSWLQKTPAAKKKVHLGPAGEQAVQSRIQVLDSALEKAEKKTLGLCDVCHEYVEPERLEMDFTASVCIDHFSAEQKRQLEMELALSHELQKALQPRNVPDTPGLKLAAFSQPAAIVGGDYYDFFFFRDCAQGLAVADVMGKGLPASMLMSSLQAALRLLVPESESPARVLERLNRLFCHSIHLVRFVTLFLGRYDPESRTLRYSNAGHNPPLVFRRQADGSGPFHWLEPTGAAIGLAESFAFEDASATLSPGDVLVLYTDGVTDAVNSADEEFGQARLAEFVRERSDSSPEELLEQFLHFLHEFTGARTFADDLTIVVAKVG